MALLDPDNPYVPGTGAKPPYLAGRVMEKAEIERALKRIKKKPDRYGSLERVSPFLVLVGPRGVGKTVLLEWARRRSLELRLDCAVLTEEILEGAGDELGEAILGEDEYNKAVREVTTSGKVGHAAVTFIGVEGQMKLPTAVLSLRSLLDRKLKSRPLLVILDEAHAVAPELLKRFCKTTQRYVQESRPLALLLAGTPGLRGAIRGIGATFMERSEFMTLNLLTKEHAREALSIPASDTGLPMDMDALETLVEWSDCYPFFIQLAGRLSWDIAKGRGAKKITMEDANQALGEAGRLRRDFYDGRYQELDEREVVTYALQVIDLIEGQPGRQVSYQELIDGIHDANEGMEHKKVVEIYKTLLNLGFMFQRDEGFEAGIPSLFDYVKEQGKLRRKGP